MKELATINANIFGVLCDDNTVLPMVEIALIMTEPVYELDAERKFVKRREMTTFRFTASPDAIHVAASELKKLAELAAERFPTKHQEEP